MNESEIIEAIEKGKNVYWKNVGYKILSNLLYSFNKILCNQFCVINSLLNCKHSKNLVVKI